MAWGGAAWHAPSVQRMEVYWVERRTGAGAPVYGETWRFRARAGAGETCDPKKSLEEPSRLG